ncbi:hypothetical protein F5B22DRAFT_610630 [Xylaria bambusicola]|uniref:uncharacterized protein n=1 Tax=Xylaria bambusicola TaxID=326684 RepID=UPI0020082A7B|nr:uncharacterized protein F5B22DRAFT_610630 [Xylaria bambusicola]KAI0514480.1 hypothetical protein F5B22DRAFT_610630 [Xylaria bambusicola]
MLELGVNTANPSMKKHSIYLLFNEDDGHLARFAFCTLACGLCTMLNLYSHGVLIVFQIFWSVGIAAPIANLLTVVQAGLTKKDNAASTGNRVLLRSYGTT